MDTLIKDHIDRRIITLINAIYDTDNSELKDIFEFIVLNLEGISSLSDLEYKIDELSINKKCRHIIFTLNELENLREFINVFKNQYPKSIGD